MVSAQRPKVLCRATGIVSIRHIKSVTISHSLEQKPTTQEMSYYNNHAKSENRYLSDMKNRTEV